VKMAAAAQRANRSAKSGAMVDDFIGGVGMAAKRRNGHKE
jgi:hypothetical protein